jgi:hypothetical protein
VLLLEALDQPELGRHPTIVPVERLAINYLRLNAVQDFSV